jgi:hypothetical protein
LFVVFVHSVFVAERLRLKVVEVSARRRSGEQRMCHRAFALFDFAGFQRTLCSGHCGGPLSRGGCGLLFQALLLCADGALRIHRVHSTERIPVRLINHFQHCVHTLFVLSKQDKKPLQRRT